MTPTSTTLVNAGATKKPLSNPIAPSDELPMDAATEESDAKHVRMPESGEDGQGKSEGEEEGGVMEEELGEEGEGEREGEGEVEEGEEDVEMEEEGNGEDQPTVSERYGYTSSVW